MKKLLLFIISLIFAFCNFNNVLTISAEDYELILNSPSVCLMEPISKKVIYEKDSHKKLYPASMTKMMGLYLILEEIDKGNVSLTDKVCCSEFASSMGGTQIYLEANEIFILEELLMAVAINSANDAIVALGEHVFGSNEQFVKKMNEKAKSLKMHDTYFNNATGFDDEEHYTSSYDMALLGSHLVGFEEKILKYTSMKEGYIRKDKDEPFWLVNTNKMLGNYQGMDGLKTGFTQKAGYNLTATAKRNGVRLVATAMKLNSIKERTADISKLLDYGFSKYKCVHLFDKDDIISTFVVDRTLKKELSCYVKEEINIILEKNINDNDIKIDAILYNLRPPYKKDNVVGYLKISINEEEYIYDLYALNDVEEINFLSYLEIILKQIFM